MKRNWIKLYSTYSKNYDKKAIKSKVGFEDKYTLNEFKTMYTAIENERKLQVKHGERKVLNVSQDLLAKQEKYLYSMKQAKELKKALKEYYDLDYKIKDIRTDSIKTDEFWKAVSDYKKQLKLQGIKDVNSVISSTFFGSP